jgi:aspartate/methionine/tyrosine aminotransferase
MFIFNNPNNPTGKNFTKDELEIITKILEEFPHVIILSDEVYDFLTFDRREHNLFSPLGSNWDRTISIFSGGKLLSCTGWRVGWMIGPAPFMKHLGIVANTVYRNNNASA